MLMCKLSCASGEAHTVSPCLQEALQEQELLLLQQGVELWPSIPSCPGLAGASEKQQKWCGVASTPQPVGPSFRLPGVEHRSHGTHSLTLQLSSMILPSGITIQSDK